MPVNHFFQSGKSIGRVSEQSLIHDLTDEVIKIHGMDMIYIPRVTVRENDILNEDFLNKYDIPYYIEIYLETINGFEGDGSILSKFGLEVRDSAVFIMSKRRWHELIGRFGTAQLSTRPTEGDIIYFPLTKAFFEIRKVDPKNHFFQAGKLYTYRIHVELMQFSHERFDTGIKEIDDYTRKTSTDINRWSLQLEDGSYMLLEGNTPSKLIMEEFNVIDITVNTQNERFTEKNDILDFSESNPFGQPLRK